MYYSRFSAAKFAILIAINTAMASAAPVKAATSASCAADSAVASDAAKAEGKRFSVVIEGKGPEIILIPGLATPRDVWEPTVSALRNCYTIHTVQIRGFGDDAGINAHGPLLEPFVRELADYIDDEIINKGRARPAIIGHSLGGLSALMVAARYPQVAGKVMVVDALPFIGTLFNPAATVDMVRPQAQIMADIMRKTPASQPSQANETDPGEKSMAGFYSNSVAGRTAVARWMKASDPRVTAQAFYDDMTTDVRAELPKVQAPVTLLYAQDDSAMTPEAATKAFVPQYTGTPVFEARMVKGSRHFIMLDQPEMFEREVEAFLKH
jgi:pimeloyl-ACP methyl ester carboxylesterase